MAVEVKFCGMTRPEDVAAAASLGVDFVGCVLADGPRRLAPGDARRVLEAAPPPVRKVGVFGNASATTIAEAAALCQLDVIQLHGSATRSLVDELRSRFGGELWIVVRVPGPQLPDAFGVAAELADRVMLDAFVPGALGGTGVPIAWQSIAPQLRLSRGSAKLVLAGGLTAANVAEAVRCLEPQVVDVSSGIESAPGRKDPARMRAFRDAVLLIREGQ